MIVILFIVGIPLLFALFSLRRIPFSYIVGNLKARRVSTGAYDVSLNSSLAGDCFLADYPREQTLPAVVTPTTPGVTATYTTTCDANDKGFVEHVAISNAAGAPTDSEFTVLIVRPVVVVEP